MDTSQPPGKQPQTVEEFWREFFRQLHKLQEEVPTAAQEELDKPIDFEEVMEIDDLEIRSVSARDFPYPWIMYATAGNGDQAKINRILWEEELHAVKNGPDLQPVELSPVPQEIRHSPSYPI